MSFNVKKRKSSSRAKDDDDIEAEMPTKRGKAASGTAFKPSAKPQADSDGSTFWEISKNRRVTISGFKGKTLLGIREFYEKDGQMLPGKKGISMSIEQYAALIEIMPQIEELLAQRGEKLPRPAFNGTSLTQHDVEENDDDDHEVERKANIEATSDEDE